MATTYTGGLAGAISSALGAGNNSQYVDNNTRNTGYLLPGDPHYNEALATGNSASAPASTVQNIQNQYGTSTVNTTSSGGSVGGGGQAAPTTHNLTLNTTVKIETNELDKPKPAMGSKAYEKLSDEEKYQNALQWQKWYQAEAKQALSEYNAAKLELTRLEMQYPEYNRSQSQSQAILNARAKVAKLENAYNTAKNYADNISASKSVTDAGTKVSGDNVTGSVTTSYVITDKDGKTVSTSFTQNSDNQGMTASELRSKQEADRNRLAQAGTAEQRAAAEQSINESQAAAERDFAHNSAMTELENYRNQFQGNLDKLTQDYQADQLQSNQDLLMSSNETFRNAVQNSREANQILSQYNLGGSSLGGRLDQIAAEAANQSNQVSALTYNQAMREADRNYGDARLALENQRADRENAYNQSFAQANADYLSRMAGIAGNSALDMSQYANADYWYGTMFDQQGNRLDNFAGTGTYDSKQMRDWANQQAAKYQGLQDQYAQQQQQYSTQQAGTVANQYVSQYQTPAAQTYATGLKSYTPVNSNTSILGNTELQPRLEQEKEGQL